jgi:hypothetical protein
MNRHHHISIHEAGAVMKNLLQRSVPFLLCLALGSCASPRLNTIEYGAFHRDLDVKIPSAGGPGVFLGDATARRDSVVKDGVLLAGYVTDNRLFLDSLLMPLLRPHVKELAGRQPASIINELTLFVHEMYRTWFGPGFYRWGGDILDLDDPQESGSGHTKRFGLDCSGFAGSPYELAVLLGLMVPSDSAAVFSSAGFAASAGALGLRDMGGRNGTSNRFRVDTHDFLRLGRVVLTVARGTAPSDAGVSGLQPGDVVGRTGHVGIIVRIHGEAYYLESGGAVLPRNGNIPYRAGPALEIFAERGDVTVRRSLPDEH